MGSGIGGSDAARELGQFSDMTAGLAAIGAAEYRARIARAQALMTEQGIDIAYIDAGSNLSYFTGINWHPSERLVGALIPAEGDITYVTPFFERGTFAGMMEIDGPIECWHEHESPYALIADWLAARGLSRGRLAIDDSAEFFLFDGLRQACPTVTITTAFPVTNGCRARKSPAEIAIMQRANDITLTVQAAAARILRPGITVAEVEDFIDKAHRRAGAPRGSSFCIVLFGPDTAFPHGVKTPKALEVGDMVLIDTGARLHGYSSDITRSYVFGTPTARQRLVWQHEQQAQLAAFAAARIGIPCAAVDAAARRSLEAQGYGPGYALPGLPHRTGHGIGLDIHEAPNLVGSDQTLLAEGMCFSVEPMLCLPGEFGVRHEDHIHMTATGPQWFTPPMPSIDAPFGD